MMSVLPNMESIKCHPDVPSKSIPPNICWSYANDEKRKETEASLISCVCEFCYHLGPKFH